MLCINPSAFGYGEVLFCKSSDQSTAFAGVRLFSAWSLRPPELCSCDLRSNAPPDRLCRRSFSAFPPPPDRPFGRSTYGGVGYGANDRPSASRLWRGVSVGFAIADIARYDFASVAASVLRSYLCLRYRSDNNRYSVLRTP